MIPRISIDDVLDATIVTQALVHYAQEMLITAIGYEYGSCERIKLAEVTRITLQLAKSINEYTKSVVEYPPTYDADLLEFLHNLT